MSRVESMVRIGADEVWADADGDGPPILLLHPGIGDSRVWDPVLPLLAGYRVIRYDCRGYGHSPASTEPYGQVADAVAVLDHFGLTRATLVGCSMGGGTAAGVAVSEPARVTGLVLLCPGIPGYEQPPEPELDAEYAEIERTRDLEHLIRLGLREWSAAGVDETTTDLMRTAVAAWVSEEDNATAAAGVFDRLGEIAAPSVLLVGDRDRPPVIDANRQAAGLIPGCRLGMLPGVDHYLPLRAPDAVAAAVHEITPI
jgi:pimeloyl-ACP methyl ester carboxylesterase